MKFLPLELTREHMLPINFLYYAPFKENEEASFNETDILTIVYKDQDSGQKIVYEIPNPTIEIYIAKPQYRELDGGTADGAYSYMRDWIDISMCDKYTVPYKSRWAFAAKKLKLNNSSEAKASPYVFGADIQIETWYLLQFILEYPTDRKKTLSIGKLDIENDIIQCDDFPKYGEEPINAVTYINMETNDVYTLILLKDHLPSTPESHPKHQYYEDLRKHFYEQVEAIKADPDMVTKLCYENFNENYPGMKYNILYYDDELALMQDLMEIIHSTDNDFIGAWNMPYDLQNILLRPNHLGVSPTEIIPDDRFHAKWIKFKEDTNPVAHKRKHTCITSTVPVFLDDMVNYAGVRQGGGVIPSLRLNAIAKRELKDDKYDYSEVSDIKHLFYDDLIRFILYNIKDVLLLTALEKKTSDTATIYSRMYEMCVFPNEAFTTTKVVWHSFIKFIMPKGFTFGTNRNRGNKKKVIFDYSSILGDAISGLDDDQLGDFDFEFGDPDDISGDDSDSESGDKEEKYDGAYVANPLHTLPTGATIMGNPSQWVHDNVADEDVTSEYPTGINICNISNETLVGRVYLQDPSEIKVSIPSGFIFRGNDEETYKMNVGNFLLETYTEGDTANFANLFLGLPSADEVLAGAAKLIEN